VSHVPPPLAGIRIAATGAYRPGTPVLSASIDERMGAPAGTCEKRLGIRARHFAGTETTSSMAVEAARRALATANWRPEDLDIVVSASAVMEQWIPTQAVLVQQQLGLAERATPALDINATCLSFLAAFDTISYAMAAGRYRRVLIVSSDMPSRALDWNDVDICGNFGDGAAAVLLERDDATSSAILASRFEVHSEGAYLCEIRSGGTLLDLRDDPEAFGAGVTFRMDGEAAYRVAARHLPAFLKHLLAAAGAGVTVGDLAAIVPHQASAAGLLHVRRLCRIPKHKMIDIFADHGNQVSASIPTALDAAVRSGHVRRGDVVLVAGTAAGITLGGMVLRY
jgi:3-oxoacyl-[acyl-carrier-protein] synthase-3